MKSNSAESAAGKTGQQSARKGNSRPAPVMRKRGRPKGSTDQSREADRAEFLAAVEKEAAKGPGWIDEAVEAVQSSREGRGKPRYTESSLRQTLTAWGREAGFTIQRHEEGWAAEKR